MSKISCIIVLLLPAAGWAAINSCPPLQTSGNVGYPGVGPNNAVYNPGLTTFTGCQVVDATFSAWETTNTGVTYIGSGITAAQSNDSLITTPTFRLATERGDFSIRTDGDNNDGNNDWSTASNNLIGGTVDFVATTTTHPIFEISYVFNGVVHGTGGTVGITPIFCLGGTATDSFTAASCTSSGGTPYSPGLTSIVGNGTQTLNFLLPSVSNRVAVSFAVNLTAGSAGTAGFNYMDLSFDEAAPEPSTFFLFGAALAVFVGVRAWRARRVAAAVVLVSRL
jgi:hypothetical protein